MCSVYLRTRIGTWLRTGCGGRARKRLCWRPRSEHPTHTHNADCRWVEYARFKYKYTYRYKIRVTQQDEALSETCVLSQHAESGDWVRH